MQSTSSPATTTADLIDRQITDELNRARKKHGAFFRGGASAPALTEREKMPTPVFYVRQHRNSMTHKLVGFLRPFDPSWDRVALRTLDEAGELARKNGWNLRVELDLPTGYPLPLAKETELTPEQVAEYQASKAAKAEPAAA